MEDVCVEEIEHTEEPLYRMETEERDERRDGEKDVTQDRNGSPIVPETPLISDTAKAERDGGIRGEKERKDREDERVIPLFLPPSRCHGGKERPGEDRGERAEAGKGVWGRREEEEGEVLDLSFPKKREIKERSLWHESSLLMEVDEVEGDGDRDIVEEDDGDDEEDSILRMDGADILGAPLLSPLFFSTSVFTSLSSIDSESEGLLLIDDQGIPYTLTPEGHKVPQMDSSRPDNPPPSQPKVQSSSLEVEDDRSSHITTAWVTYLSRGLVKTPHTHKENTCPTPVTSMKPSQKSELLKNTEHSKNPELSQNAEPPKVLDSDVKSVSEASAVVSQPSGSAVHLQPPQPIQILTNPSSNTPILLFPSSPQLSSIPLTKTDANPGLLAFSLPLSLTQNTPSASTSMFLLLSSSTTSSSGQSFSTSTPIALIDPSTGQLSQITASSSSPLSLSLSSGQLATSVSSLPANPSHPVIRTTPNNSPTILPRESSSVNLPAPLTSPSVVSSPPSKQPSADGSSKAVLLSSPPHKHTEPNCCDPNTDHQSLSTEETQMESVPNGSSPTKAPPFTHPQSPSLSFDFSLEASDQSKAPESKHTSLPWDDHLYFSSATAPPSPPLAPIFPSSEPRNLNPLDPLDPLSPASSPSSGPRRVLYCPLCPRIFYYLSDLERHSITHSQNKPHVCLQCGKAFKRSSHLQRHKHIHTGERNFVCPICSKRFREAGELQRHQRVHTGEKPYQCPLCHTRFAERNTMRRHTRRKHPYHQAAMEMLSERGAGGGGREGWDEDEGTEEWYSSTVSNLDNSDSEPDSEVTS
ncbi:fez family zinc finger protein erm-like [Oncorhynchus mykiss]|uniref:C2H2-type domain-containing protein n=1 Tax=Oncorhynchus mykiss TaxID=8022 RepID=A0A8C7M5J7_ONCMY|nr:fez family zinc finger protein erm-like [Oncorhynchus mykiss]